MTVMADPGADGRFGEFGGRFVPETLVPACAELEQGFTEAWADPAFRTELDDLLWDYAGRPSILTECWRLSEHLGLRLDGRYAAGDQGSGVQVGAGLRLTW